MHACPDQYSRAHAPFCFCADVRMHACPQLVFAPSLSNTHARPQQYARGFFEYSRVHPARIHTRSRQDSRAPASVHTRSRLYSHRILESSHAFPQVVTTASPACTRAGPVFTRGAVYTESSSIHRCHGHSSHAPCGYPFSAPFPHPFHHSHAPAFSAIVHAESLSTNACPRPPHPLARRH